MNSTRIRSSHDVDIRHGCWLELNFIFRHAEVSAEQGRYSGTSSTTTRSAVTRTL